MRTHVTRVASSVLLLTALVTACSEERPVARDIDVREMTTEEALRTAASNELLSQLRIYDMPDRIIYEAPTPLARPAGVTDSLAAAQPAGAPAGPAQRDTSAARPPTAPDTTRRE